MKLSPKQRRKIYEEEKARIEAEQKQGIAQGGSTTELEPNVAGLLCYLAGWITGIIFLVIEQKNKFVRFHAMQSIVTFGILTIASAFLSWIPSVGGFFASVIGILAFILWVILMLKAYQGELYKLPLAGNVAEGLLPLTVHGEKPETGRKQKTAEAVGASQTMKSKKVEDFGERVGDYFAGTKAGRVAGYSAVIFWDVVLLIFFSFFHRYIAWYHTEPDGSVIGLPMITNDYFAWLPILVTALVLSIAAYIILIIYDKYWLREIIQIVLSVIGVAVVVNLISIFPFNFNVIPNDTAVYVVPVALTIVLILIAVGLGVGALVRFIKLVVNLARQS